MFNLFSFWLNWFLILILFLLISFHCTSHGEACQDKLTYHESVVFERTLASQNKKVIKMDDNELKGEIWVYHIMTQTFTKQKSISEEVQREMIKKIQEGQ